MANEPWRELDEDDIRGGAKEFKQLIKKANIDDDLAEEILSQVSEIANEKHNIICIFTNSDWAVTCIHVPDEALSGEESPVLMRGANPRHIIAAFAQNEIRKRIRALDELEIITGLQQGADEIWIKELENICEEVMVKLEHSPPEMWEDLLKGPE